MIAVLGIPSAARADWSSDKGIAEALFRDAKQRLDSGDVDGACPRFQDSQKVDPALGTLLYLATCHERQGRTATAWSEFASASSWADRSNQQERGNLARKHIVALEARLFRLTIHAAAAKTAGLEIRVDSGPMSAASVGIPLPLDPGAHTVEASAPDCKSWRTAVNVPKEPGESTLEIPALDPAPVPTLLLPTAGMAPRSDASLDSRDPGGTQTAGSRSVAPWLTMGLGAIALGIGATYGVLAIDQRGLACPNGGTVCAQSPYDKGLADADASTILLASGGALVLTGLLWEIVFAPGPKAVARVDDLHPVFLGSGVGCGGSF